jgi:hypothetical protein
MRSVPETVQLFNFKNREYILHKNLLKKVNKNLLHDPFVKEPEQSRIYDNTCLYMVLVPNPPEGF